MASAVPENLLSELADWAPEGGVVSAYVSIDPADRGEGWRIERRHALEGLDSDAAARVLERFPDDAALPHGRTHVGFLELGGARREIWNGFQLDEIATDVVVADRPCLAPLVKLLDDGWPVGVALVS